MRGNVAGVNGGDDLQQWFRDIPFVSIYLTIFSYIQLTDLKIRDNFNIFFECYNRLQNF